MFIKDQIRMAVVVSLGLSTLTAIVGCMIAVQSGMEHSAAMCAVAGAGMGALAGLASPSATGRQEE